MNSLRKFIIVFLLLFFFGFAVSTVFYNTVKIIPEFTEWGRLTDAQKREKIFGDQYLFYKLLDTHTEDNAQILFYTENGMAYYVERYYLYPKKIIYLSDKTEFLKIVARKKYRYIAVYDANVIITGYKAVTSLSPSALHKGVLYEIK